MSSPNVMSTQFTVYKGSKEGAILKGTTHRVLKHDDVLVKVTHSGLCYTDVHYRTSDMVLGHEGVGVVESVGPNCHDLKA